MPTARPRHTVTETPPVQAALDKLRRRTGSRKVDLAELVVLGAREKERQLRHEGDAALRARGELAEMIRGGTLPESDVQAADEVKHLGLVAADDE